jgi:3-mercaptopropionate dioxygenase
MLHCSNTSRLSTFVAHMTELVSRPSLEEDEILREARGYLEDLLAIDDWLPDDCAVPHAGRYSQYLLHCDPLERFSVVSFVWGPGQSTPIHDHTVWGLIGMLRGAEVSHHYEYGSPMVKRGCDRLETGMIDVVSPSIGDIHQVCNAFDDRSSISIHVYGANIGTVRRHVFNPVTGERKAFISGYSNDRLPYARGGPIW